MIYLEKNSLNISTLIENQFPYYVQENNQTFLKFLSSYYESQEGKYQPLDIVSNLIDYYNISYYKPTELIESTNTTSDITVSGDEISVKSTIGFPNSGYIQIGSEIIFYANKTLTTFNECVRGTTALILKPQPKSDLVLTTSKASFHKSGVTVTNIAFEYAKEFFDRIKSELAVLLPEVLVDSLDIGSFISKIKSFYAAKGSLNGHRILFRILFNDRKFNIKFKSRGKNAELKINNYNGKIPEEPKPEIVNGGIEYDARKENGVLINPPVVEIFGSGVGVTNAEGLRPNLTAVVNVTDINSSGTITDIEVENTGEGYRGPITARVRPKNFEQDQLVYNLNQTGTGRVEFYDPDTEELILTNVIGYFSPNEEILTDDGEKSRAFIAKSFTTPILSRTGFLVQGEEQNIEFPKDYTFKTSDSKYKTKKIIRCKLFEGYSLPNDKLPEVFTLKQDADTKFGVKGVEIAVDSKGSLSSGVYEFDISSNASISGLYLPPSTLITKSLTGISSSLNNFVVTVDDASGFPFTNGIIFVKGKEITYSKRSNHQFFGCNYTGSATFDLGVKDEVVSFGRNKYTIEWQSGETINKGEYRFYGNNLYISDNVGVTGSTAPTHTSGRKYDGTESVLWRYFDTNRYDYSLYIEVSGTNPKFQLIGLPGEITIEESGALYTTSDDTYEFVDFDSPNIKVYNFTTNEISDRLSLVLATNFNTTRSTVTDNRLPSYQSLIGFSTQYDYEDYIYVPSSAIPRWWDDIVDLSQSTLSSADQKKVAFTNQTLLSRWKKSGLIYETQTVTEFTKTKKLLGLNIDAIQLNSYKGNTVNYGHIEKFFIGDGGDYPVSYTETSGIASSINDDKNPKFTLTPDKTDTGVAELDVSNTSNLTKISSSIKKINFTKIYQYFTPAVTNPVTPHPLESFTNKPKISVVNNNPQLKVILSSFSSFNLTDNLITQSNHGLNIGDEVTFITTDDYFTNLKTNVKYFVNKISDNQFSLHKNKSDALIDSSRISVQRKDTSGQTTFPTTVRIEKKQRNPLNFEDALLEISYKNGKIDNIIVKKSGNGYINLPSIVISGGGLTNPINIPFSHNGDIFVEMSGSLISYENYDNKNYTVIEKFTTIDQDYKISPKVTVNNGKLAKAITYVSDGKIVSVSLLDAGESYSVPPTVLITGDGTDAVITSNIDTNGVVTGFTIVNPGSGYTFAPRIDIIPVGSGAVLSSKLKEWTFNMIRQLNKENRIDSYGGYVYDDGDAVPGATNNPNKFKVIDYKLDFPKDIDEKQYYLLQNSNKLLAKYIREKYSITGTDSQVLSAENHSPAIAISYDGIPIYGGNKVYVVRNEPSQGLGEIKSRYKLKYNTSPTGDSNERSVVINGTTYYLNRIGGPSLTDYPIGSFIEDYEWIEGTDNDLDVHNGRFSITPEFPSGRYVYYATTSSYDNITNNLVQNSSIGNNGISFNGFPYFIGDTFAGEYDTYMNTRCRTNDKIPSRFTRIFEKTVDAAPLIGFAGLSHNDEYPSENDNLIKTILSTNVVTPGSVDSVIIENSGDGYNVGDRLDIDNSRTFGSGFSAFISKVGGKTVTSVTNSAQTQYKKLQIKTSESHNLKVGDYISINYAKPSMQIPINLHEVSGVNESPKLNELTNLDLFLRENQSLDTFSGKKIYSLNLNFKYTYLLRLKANSEFKLTYDIENVNEFFTLEESPTDTILLDMEKIPNRLYLHVNDGVPGETEYIYELNKTQDFLGTHRVSAVDNISNTFSVEFNESTQYYEKQGISYSVKSINVSGPIEEVSIANEGYNYRKLPTIRGIIKKGTENDVAGNGKAVLQTNSNTIGKLKNIKYDSIGSSLTANNNVNYYIDTPATAKVLNNFEIYDVEIINGGENYNNVVTILANGSSTNAKFRAIVSIGTIVGVEILDGGTNFTEEPTLTIQSQNGSGAKLKAKIRRKNLNKGSKILGITNPSLTNLFPIQVDTTVVDFDPNTSTLQFDENKGQFKDNDILYTEDGKIYGKIVSIRRSKAYAKVTPNASLLTQRSDITGNTSESLQKLTDSYYYQDWSYIISSSRDTREWINEQTVNTHPAGHKQFGKKIIENRKSFFKRPSDVFKSSLIFTTNITNNIDLKVKKSPCEKQKLLFQNNSNFQVGDYFYGITSGAVGLVIGVGEEFVHVELIKDIRFVLGEVVVEVSLEFAFESSQTTTKIIAFVNGIMQQLNESYNISVNEDGSQLDFVPKFAISSSDQIVIYESSTDYDSLDPQIITAGSSQFALYQNANGYSITDSTKEQFIISIGGSVQKTDDINISNNLLTLSSPIEYDSPVFAFRNQNLRKLTFTGSGTTYTLNYAPSSPCNLMIFHISVGQSHLLTDYSISGNTITLSESVNQSDLFGWYLNETATCSLVDTSQLNNNKVLFIIDCQSKNFTKYIESNTVKHPNSLYEIRKEIVDGTVYPVNSTTIEGFDTKFTYTSPRYSSSYVEVVDRVFFNGSSTQFNLTKDNNSYQPSNGEESLVVYVDNVIIDHDQYSVSGSTITFSQTYTSPQECTIIDFISGFSSNTNNENGTIIDRLQAQQNGSRSTFNLSDRGVPKYVNNTADIFNIKNGSLKIPASSYIDHRNLTLTSHNINDNKITFVTSPPASEDNKLAFFNRQLLPEPSKNVILDRLRCFDGVRDEFPITVNGILLSPISAKHFYVVRNGVMQKPDIDFTLSGHTLTFTIAPKHDDIIFIFYSYDSLNQNIVLDFANYVDGTQTDFSLTVNYQSTNIVDDHHLMVFRNSVQQTVGTDYTVLSDNSGPYIRFTTAPQISDRIYMINVVDSNFTKLTFTQSSANSITLTSSQYLDDMFIIFVNGVPQVGNAYTTSYSSGQYTITFANNVSLTNDIVSVYAFSGTGDRRELDSIAVTNTSTLSYQLTYNSAAVTNIVDETNIIVTIEGVVQEPGVSYTVSGSTITFNTTALYQTGVTINIFQIGDSINSNEYIDYIDDNYSKTTRTINGVNILPTRYKLVEKNGFQSFNPLSADDLFILRNGVIQNPTQDFTIGNGYIEFTTNVVETEDIFVMYTHGVEELTVSSSGAVSSSVHRYTLSSALASNEYGSIILYADGVPRFFRRNDFTVENSGTELHLTHTDGIAPTQVFVMKYPSVTLIDDPDDCPNGSRTVFKLLYNDQNLNVSNTAEDADILISINGVVQHPGTQYTLSANRGLVTMSYAPQTNDEIFMVRMLGNQLRNLSSVGGNQYSITTETNEKENVVVFSNNTWKFSELGDFIWINDNRIQLTTPHTSGNLFAIKFYGVFNLLDQIHNPFNGSNTRFNLFDGEENFVPVGTVDNDNNPDETSLIVFKNGKLLDPKVDFTLGGDIESQIIFSAAPVSSDVISVRSVGSFDKLDTITGGSGTIFPITKNGSAYYPNAHIERPRELENQLILIKDGNIQSPLYDYYINNNKIVFVNSVSFSKLVILDFRGTYDDIKVFNRFKQIEVGDELTLTGEDTHRIVSEIVSPTVLRTQSYTGDGVTKMTADTTLTNGKVSSINIINQGLGYTDPVILRTLGTGTGARSVGTTNQTLGGVVVSNEIKQSGHNIYNDHIVYPTVYASVYKKQPLHKSQIRKGTKLSSNINNTVETIPLANTFELASNSPTVTATDTNLGQDAEFKVYISGGEVRKIDIVNAGSGYDDRSTVIEVTGGGGTGCVLEPVLDGSGAFTDVIIRNPGVGYDTFRVIINREVIEYTYVSANQIDGCTRGVIGSADSHNQNDIVYFDNYI